MTAHVALRDASDRHRSASPVCSWAVLYEPAREARHGVCFRRRFSAFRAARGIRLAPCAREAQARQVFSEELSCECPGKRVRLRPIRTRQAQACGCVSCTTTKVRLIQLWAAPQCLCRVEALFRGACAFWLASMQSLLLCMGSTEACRQVDTLHCGARSSHSQPLCFSNGSMQPSVVGEGCMHGFARQRHGLLRSALHAIVARAAFGLEAFRQAFRNTLMLTWTRQTCCGLCTEHDQRLGIFD